MDDLRAAAEELATAYDRFAAIGHARGAAAARNNLGDVCIRLGDINRAERYLEDEPAIAVAVNPSRVCNRALLGRIRGDYAGALRLNAECLAFAAETGAIQLTAMARSSMGMCHLGLGDPVTAESLMAEAHAAAVAVGSEVDMYDAAAGLALVCARTGRAGEASVWAASLAELMERGLYSGSGDDWAHAAVVEVHLAAGRLNDALAAGSRSLDLLDRSGRRLAAMRVRIVTARAAAARGDTGAARVHRRAALSYAVEQDLPERHHIDG
ncbi:hypothetical protein ACQP2F_19510 [Actinoplanes sp. CA-030573]|uniref:hypothetical protein n=1 Tax=Actinoplanes sp. CA-030573 TaxID=3239898 RepID=UPI003D8C8882